MFDVWERDLLIELVRDRIDGIKSGEISGFGQPVDAELRDTELLLAKVEAL